MAPSSSSNEVAPTHEEPGTTLPSPVNEKSTGPNTHSTPAKTPKGNNYAAPHTPIASAKRPRAASNRNLASSVKIDENIDVSEEGGENESQQYRTPVKHEEGDSLPLEEKENRRDVGGNLQAAETNMSPMHPPRPVVSRIDADNDGEDVDDNEKDLSMHSSGSASSTGWKSKVDQLFSPVLSFLNGSGSSTGNAGDEENPVAGVPGDGNMQDRVKIDADGDVDMTSVEGDHPQSMHPAVGNEAATVSYSTVDPEESEDSPRSTEENDAGADHHEQTAVPTTCATTVVYDSNTHEVAPSNDEEERMQYHEQEDNRAVEQEEDGVDEEEEEEFNPYLFIKSLPPYCQVVSDPTLKICLPPKSHVAPPIALVLDLDETLVHCTVEPIPDADMIFPVVFNGIEYKVHVRTRPYLAEFLESVYEKFEVIVFTASQKVYADELLDRIDPGQKYIRHRMFRESCLPVEGNYLKDLNVLGRDLRQAVLVDNSPHAFGYQVDNGIPIESWFDDPQDTELLKLERFLRTLHGTDDVREVVRAKFRTYELVRDA